MNAEFRNGGRDILLTPQSDSERQLCEMFVNRLHAKKRHRLHMHNYGWESGPPMRFTSMLIGIIKWPKEKP